ncbi:MAG: SPOR domain-containing protein [Bacteroidales bacterium]
MAFVRRARWIYLIFVVGFAASALSGKCQRTLSPQALKAIDLFESRQFEQSAEQFRKLMNRYPGDPLYVFYYAASLIELNQDLEVAIALLKNSLIQLPLAEGYYYLGIAYFRQFRWDEAREAFAEARKLIHSKAKNERTILLAASNLENLIDHIEKPVPFRGQIAANFPYDSLTYRLQQLPALYASSIRYNNQVYWSYFAELKDTGSIMYFSAPGKQGNYNIYMQIRDKKSGRVRIEELTGVNTEADELWPVYDPVQQMLYFASNRLTGLAGFDIYRCKTDREGHLLSSPELLPFPLNSPWNDYLVIPVDSSSCFLISDRACRPSSVILYRIERSTTSSIPIDRETLLNCCFFRNNFAIRATPFITTTSVSAKKSGREESVPIDERIVQITKALILQKIIDSLQLNNLILRERLDGMPNDDNRKALYAQWKKNDSDIKTRQNEVNDIYSRLVRVRSKPVDTLARQSRVNDFTFGRQPVYSAENPIPEQLNFPAGVVYTIQLGVFSKKVEPSFFKGIQPIVAEFLNDKNLIKYYAGVFTDFTAADSSLQIIKKAGFKEAFIVAYYDNKKIPLSRAQELEKVGNQ